MNMIIINYKNNLYKNTTIYYTKLKRSKKIKTSEIYHFYLTTIVKNPSNNIKLL